MVKSLCTMAGIHFKKFPNSYDLRVENCQLKSRTIKCPSSYWGKYSVQIGSKSPTNPLVSLVVGLNIDRCIIRMQFSGLALAWLHKAASTLNNSNIHFKPSVGINNNLYIYVLLIYFSLYLLPGGYLLRNFPED